MRCPKCGFISFDHVNKCLKCSKEMKAATAEFQGTTFNATAPAFLTLSSSAAESSDELADSDDSGGIDFSDGGIDGLFDSEAETEDEELSDDDEFSFDDFGEEESSPESDDMTMDLGQFEDEVVEEPADLAVEEIKLDEDLDDFPIEEETLEPESKQAPAMDVPDELKDMSDLTAPDDEPALEMEASPSEVQEETDVSMDLFFDEAEEGPADTAPEEKEESSGSGDIDFDGLDLDLDLGGDASGTKFKEEDISGDQLSDMSLSEIDLSSSVGSDDSAQEEKKEASDIDPDLDFDLDLYGIKLAKDDE